MGGRIWREVRFIFDSSDSRFPSALWFVVGLSLFTLLMVAFALSSHSWGIGTFVVILIARISMDFIETKTRNKMKTEWQSIRDALQKARAGDLPE